MFNQKKLARFLFVGALCISFLYLEKLKNESIESENA